MSFFGSNRSDRRRRVLAEESSADASTVVIAAPRAAAPAGKSERYTAAARRENHPRATDFLPRRAFSIAGWFVLAVLTLAGLLFCYAKSADEGVADAGLVSLFDASQGGSLAGWFSSMLFAFAAIACVLVYCVRRHKVDDYRGRYRLWLWCAAAWLAMSVDATANLHAPLSRSIARASGWSLLPGGAIWWIMIWGAILGILALRLAVEVRPCRLALVAFAATFALWTAALAIDYGWLPLHNNAALAAIGCRLFGQVMLLLAIGVYGRHVLLDAEGLLRHREPKPAREKPKKKVDKPAAASSRNDAAHSVADRRSDLQPHARPGERANVTSASSSASGYSSANDEDEERYSQYDDDDYGDRKLSKAERKRLRKQMRRQQRDEDDDR
jgi:hypothetical protein